jgi:hypothetical protein
MQDIQSAEEFASGFLLLRTASITSSAPRIKQMAATAMACHGFIHADFPHEGVSRKQHGVM